MNKILVLLFVSNIAIASPNISENCTLNGIALHGKVQVVDAFADFEVEVVNNFADLRVEKVNSLANSCGQWQFVDSLPDFTIKFVDDFADFSIQYVDSFPGID